MTTYALLAGGLASVIAGLLALLYKSQRDTARTERDTARSERDGARHDLVQTQIDAAEHLSRSANVISNLKAELAERTKELDEYAAKDPKLAGSRLDRVLSSTGGQADSATSVSTRSTPDGKKG